MRALLDVCFFKYVIVAFGSSNYKYAFSVSYTPFLYILSWIILIISIFLTKQWFKSEAPSKTVLQFIYMIQFVPFTTMLGAGCFGLGFCIYTLAYWIMIGVFSKILLNKTYNDFDVLQTSHQEKTLFFEIAITLISGLTVLYFGYINGFKINLNILNAYDLREIARTYTTATGSTYLLGLSRILIPTGLVYSIRKKKMWMLSSFIIFSLLDYSFDGSKTLFFICIVALLVAIFYNKKFNKYIPFFLNVFLLLGYIEFAYNAFPFIYRLIIRRLFFVPNVINNAFYDYMLTHSPNMFSNLLRFIGINPSYDIAYMIGADSFYSADMSANTGTIGDAVWQFKYVGFLILPFLIILLLKYFDYSAKHIPFEMVIIPCVIFAYYLNNSSFTAACFSHGLICFCIIIQLYKSRFVLKRNNFS